MLAEELENQCAAFLVAQDSITGQVMGYAGLLVMADEGYITNVAVRPECRRNGIAGKLLQVFLDFGQANHLAFVTLEVRASNLAAKALYLGQGFQLVGTRRNYYKKPAEDAELYRKELEQDEDSGSGILL